MRQYPLLLKPAYYSFRNRTRRLEPGARLRTAALGLLGISVWGFTFYAFVKVLRYFQGIEVIGPLLAAKLLSMIFLVFFGILIISNIITALSTYYLADELDLLNQVPADPSALFFARFTESLLESSWMVIFFGLPIFLAYGVVHASPLFYYLWFPLVLAFFLLIPGTIGASVTLLLVNLFPARRTREILLFLALLIFIAVYLMFRLLRPERLVDPDAFQNALSYFAAMKIPAASYHPYIWATNAILPALNGWPGGNGFLSLALLVSTSLAFVVLAEWLHQGMYRRGFSRSQEAKRSGYFRRTPLDYVLSLLTLPFSPPTRAIFAKEVKFFFRDTTQWSQLFLLAALVTVYLYNFKAIPLARAGMPTFYVQNLISFLNLALAGFVLAALSARFVFPMVSMEGRAFWIIRSSPLSARQVIWAKFGVMIFPLLILSEILIIFSNHLLQVSRFMNYLSAITMFFMTFGIVGLAIGVGAAYPRFDIENPAKIAAGYGGVVYMLISMTFIGVVVALEARPVYVYFMSYFRGIPITAGDWIGLSVFFVGAAVLNVVAFIVPIRMGIKSLEKVPLP